MVIELESIIVVRFPETFWKIEDNHSAVKVILITVHFRTKDHGNH